MTVVKGGFLFCCACELGLVASARTVTDWRDGWRFRHFGGSPWGEVAKEDGNAVLEDFDDASWATVRVPHDWGIGASFDSRYHLRMGGLPCFGTGVYRRRFVTGRAAAARLEFDGAMSGTTVFVNGCAVASRPFGYASFAVDVTPYLRPVGETNVVAVRCVNETGSSRWYTGGGLYRNVRLVETAATRVRENGVCIRTTDGGDVSIDVELDGPTEGVEIRRSILGETGFSVARPRLWDVDAPNLYTARVEVVRGGAVIDAVEERFGFRQAAFRPSEGFFLNGRHLKINGVCLHHDLGALGAAVDSAAIRRQIRILKDMGANAIRTAHNPPAPELLRLCDEMGMMVLDEAFDVWTRSKIRHADYAKHFPAWHVRDLVDFIRRDRNHPSVIAWSVGNELPEQKEAPQAGAAIARELVDIAHREDPTRPVTYGIDFAGAYTNGFAAPADIYGANYRPDDYGELLRLFPDKGVLGTETSSMVSSRDTYFFPLPDGFARRPRPFRDERAGMRDCQVSSYDIFAQRPTNYHPDVEFFYQDRYPQVYGEFVWTGFDYLGEPDPHGAAARSSYYGVCDLAGFPKDRFYAYRAYWRPDVPTAHLLPHWTWPGREGARTPVWAYTSGDAAELFVNGVSQGVRKKDKPKGVYTLEWNDVTYWPGEIRLVAYKNGAVWAEAVRRTAGKPVALRLEREPSFSGDELTYFKVALVDAAGTVVPNADVRIDFAVSGPYALAGVCNGDPTDRDGLQQPFQRTFRGLVQVIVRRAASASRDGVLPGDGSLSEGGVLSATAHDLGLAATSALD